MKQRNLAVGFGCLMAVMLVLLALTLRGRAEDFPVAASLTTDNQTNTFSSFGASYASAATNRISFASYHTFQTVLSSTNAATIGLDRSLDGANWTVVGTNTFASPGGSGEQTMAGKWNYSRIRIYGSNVTATVYYLGARQ